MVSLALLGRSLRRLHVAMEGDPVPGELRGWSYDVPPMRPRAYMSLGVSEVAYGAACGWRGLWARRRLGERVEPSESMVLGGLVHEAFHRASRDVRRLLSRGVSPWKVSVILTRGRPRWLPGNAPGWVEELYRMLVVAWAGEAASRLLYYGGEGVGFLPWLSEYRVDGSPLGLSRRLRVDALGEAGVVVEVKLGYPKWWHKVGLAGYAMALESSLEAPVDYGLLVGVSVSGGIRVEVEPVYLSGYWREEFIKARDEAIDVLLSDYMPPEGGCEVSGE